MLHKTLSIITTLLFVPFALYWLLLSYGCGFNIYYGHPVPEAYIAPWVVATCGCIALIWAMNYTAKQVRAQRQPY